MRPTNIGTIRYEPSQVPTDISDINVLRRYLFEEFERVAATIRLLAVGHLDLTFVAPDKPRTGDIRYADGTQWDPGAGEGVYFLNQANIWTQLG